MRLWVCPLWGCAPGWEQQARQRSRILLSSMIAKTFAPENGVKSCAIMRFRSGVRIAAADMGSRGAMRDRRVSATGPRTRSLDRAANRRVIARRKLAKQQDQDAADEGGHHDDHQQPYRVEAVRAPCARRDNRPGWHRALGYREPVALRQIGPTDLSR